GRGEGDVHDRDIEDDHQLGDRDHAEDQPAVVRLLTRPGPRFGYRLRHNVTPRARFPRHAGLPAPRRVKTGEGPGRGPPGDTGVSWAEIRAAASGRNGTSSAASTRQVRTSVPSTPSRPGSAAPGFEAPGSADSVQGRT